MKNILILTAAFILVLSILTAESQAQSIGYGGNPGYYCYPGYGGYSNYYSRGNGGYSNYYNRGNGGYSNYYNRGNGGYSNYYNRGNGGYSIYNRNRAYGGYTRNYGNYRSYRR